MSIENKVKEMLVLSGGLNSAKDAIDKLFKMIYPDMSISDEEILDIMSEQVPTYVELFTEEEIDAAIAWHSSEAGKKFAEKSTNVLENTQEVTSKAIEKLLQKKLLEMQNKEDADVIDIFSKKEPNA